MSAISPTGLLQSPLPHTHEWLLLGPQVTRHRLELELVEKSTYWKRRDGTSRAAVTCRHDDGVCVVIAGLSTHTLPILPYYLVCQIYIVCFFKFFFNLYLFRGGSLRARLSFAGTS